MAFVQEFEDEDQGQGQPQQGGQVVTSTGTSTITGGGSQTPAAQGARSAKPTRTGWSNLQNYLTANRGNDASMGQRIAGKIGEQAQGVEAARTAIVPAAQQDIARSTVTDQGIIEALRTNPTKVDKDRFQTQAGATYEGPQDVSEYADYARGQQAATGLEERLGLTKTEEGQKALLQDIARPNYSSGLANLDQFILSAGEEGKKSIAGTQQQYGNVAQDWSSLLSGLNEQFRQAKATTEETAAQTQKAYEDVLGATKGGLQQTAATLPGVNKARAEQVTRLQSQFASKDPKVRADLAKTLGITPQVLNYLQNTLGYKPQEIVNYAGDLALGDIVNPEDRARYEALLSLGDRASEFSFAGTGKAKPVQIKTDILKAAADALALRSGVESRTAAEQKKRKDIADRVMKKVAAGQWDAEVQRETGLTQEDVFLAKQGSVGGGPVRDPRQLTAKVAIDTALKLTPGAALNVGDVATAKERKAWQDLMKILGSRDKLSLADVQKEGSALTANVGQFRGGVEAARTKSEKQTSINNFVKKPLTEYELIDNTQTGKQRREKHAQLMEQLKGNDSLDQKLLAISSYQTWVKNNPTVVTF